jgi:hypothetical protein
MHHRVASIIAALAAIAFLHAAPTGSTAGIAPPPATKVSAHAAQASSAEAQRSRAATERFELLSRTLVQGPARAVCFFPDGVIIGTGGGLAVSPADKALRDATYLPIDGEPYEIVVEGRIAYVAANNGGLKVIDLLDLAHPNETFSFPVAQATSCAVAGRELFLATVNGALFSFDIADPRIPVLKETKTLESPAVSLSAEGNALAVIHAKKAEVFDVQNGAMRKRVEIESPGEVTKGLLGGGILYLLMQTGELRIWDIAGDGPPRALETPRIKDIIDVAVSERSGIALTRLAFVVPFEIVRERVPRGGASKARLRIGTALNGKAIEEKKGAMPETANRSSAPCGTTSQSGIFTGVSISGTRFALVSAFDCVRLCDIEGARVRLIDWCPTRGFAIGLIAARGYLYVANGYDGVRIGAVRTNGMIDWIGHLQTEEARGVALSGDILVIADGEGGIKTADVAEPERPAIIGVHPSPYFMSAVVVQGGRAYCAGGLGGAEIVDIANPRRPALVWRKGFSEVRGLWVDRRFLYMTDGFQGLRIFSLGANGPAELSDLDTPGWMCDCLVSKNTAYLADGGRGIAIADVSNRRKPRLLGSVSVGSIARYLALRGKTLFVAAYTSGIVAVDVSNPRKPAVEAARATVDDGRGVFVDDDFVYVASGSGGVYVFRYR